MVVSSTTVADDEEDPPLPPPWSDTAKVIIASLTRRLRVVHIEDYKTLTRILERNNMDPSGPEIFVPWFHIHKSAKHDIDSNGRIEQLSIEPPMDCPSWTLSGEFGRFDALQRLSLLDCTLDTSSLLSLSLKALTRLRLRDCNWKGGSTMFSQLDSLKSLELIRCGRSSKLVPKDFSSCKNLEELIIDHCRFRQGKITNLPSIERLDLKNFDTKVCDLSSLLKTTKHIRLPTSSVQLPQVKCPNVITFHLRCKKNDGARTLQRHIAWAAKYLPALETFRIGRSEYGVDDYYNDYHGRNPFGKTYFLRAFSSTVFENLRSFRFDLRISNGEDFVQFFFTCVRQFPSLESFSYRYFDFQSMQDIASHLRRNKDFSKLAWNSKIKSLGGGGRFVILDCDDDDDRAAIDIARAFPNLGTFENIPALSGPSRIVLNDNRAGRVFVEGKDDIIAPRTISGAAWPFVLAKAGRRDYCTDETSRAIDTEKEKHQKNLQSNALYYLLRNGPVLRDNTQAGAGGESKRKRVSLKESPLKRGRRSGR
mmetsp:Transcript_46153/g.112829  ORF Transcript_46153/g.112829 Transcript_46153/m.112829 type:complete len:536 (+) Transcript_46153:104-1711(+)